MIAENQRKTNIGVGIGIVLQLIGNAVLKSNPFGIVIALIGFAFFIWGCSNYCKGKGYSPFLGILGILSLIGLIILVVLPDKNK